MDNQLALVTGGAGFIGSELVHQLAQRNFRVRAVDNLVTGKKQNLEGLIGPGVELIVADIRDEAAMTSHIEGVDLIFHLASLGLRHSAASPIENHAVNASATLGLLKIARGSGVNRFVHVSSFEVYGGSQQLPFSEQHPTLPTSVHSASKLAGEAYARAFWETYRYPTVVVRPFPTYGPRSYPEEMIPTFMLQCMADDPIVIFGDGTQTLDFTYVSDMAEGILAAGLSPNCVGQTINLGSGFGVQTRELASSVAQVLGKTGAGMSRGESRPDDDLHSVAGISRAQQLLDFETNVSLQEGLSRLRDCYLRQRKTAAEQLQREAVRNSESRNVPSHV